MIADTKTVAAGDATDWTFRNISVEGRSSIAIGTSANNAQGAKLRLSHEVTKRGQRRSLIQVSLPVPVTKTGATGSFTGTEDAVINITITRPDSITEGAVADTDSDTLANQALKAACSFAQHATYGAEFWSGQA